jgi:pyruvate/2-oxoglutarate dehydrogenase complex dihydrolipoamide acyltransferase (E2) component
VPRDFKLPDIGEGLTEAEIVRWLVAEGDTVESDQPLVEVETDKAVVEIPSPYAGLVLKLGGAEGEVIEVGQVLVVIGEAGETAESEPQAQPASPKPDQVPMGRTATEASPIVGTLSEQAEMIESSATESEEHALEVKALPIVRKLARENEIDLTEITGTGPHGRITREDVESAIARRQPVTEEPSQGVQVEEPEPVKRIAGEDRRKTMSRLRRTIAANMSKSWSEIPHVTTFDDVDATRLLEVREALGDRHGQKIPMEALVIRAVAPALEEFPEFNASLDGDDLIEHGSLDIGIAIDSPDGLLVAVIRDAGSMGVLDLSAEVRRLGGKGKDRSLAPDELGGQTFTVSNIGAVGGGHGTPIVPHGTTAILSVGRARERPIVYEGELVIAPVMPLSLSYDHRVVDGAQGRRFMSMVIENLEEPALFLA